MTLRCFVPSLNSDFLELMLKLVSWNFLNFFAISECNIDLIKKNNSLAAEMNLVTTIIMTTT